MMMMDQAEQDDDINNNVEDVGQRSVEIFTDISHPASFSHPEKVLRYLRQEEGMSRARLQTVKQALSMIPSYSRFKPLTSRYPRMTTRADDADERWQLDLMNVVPFNPGENDGYQYLLIIIDVFTRRLTVVPLYDKTSKEATAATELIFMTSGRIPKSITTDSGREFMGKEFKSLCRKYDIKLFTTIPNVTHATIAERVIKTLRIKIGKYMLHHGTKRYIDVLESIVEGYNNSVHSTLEITPNEAAASLANRQIALFNLNKNLNQSPRDQSGRKKWKNAKIDAGDIVRIPILPLRRFKKSHEPSFSPDTYVVDHAFMNDKERLVARFLNQGGELMRNTPMKRSYFYPNELSAAAPAAPLQQEQ